MLSDSSGPLRKHRAIDTFVYCSEIFFLSPSYYFLCSATRLKVCLFCFPSARPPPPQPPPALSPDSRWPNVNYFVSHHISFNCSEFVYPADQIEPGEAAGGCQGASDRKTDECISNGLTRGPLPAHMISLTAVWIRVCAHAPNSAMLKGPTITTF